MGEIANTGAHSAAGRCGLDGQQRDESQLLLGLRPSAPPPRRSLVSAPWRIVGEQRGRQRRCGASGLTSVHAGGGEGTGKDGDDGSSGVQRWIDCNSGVAGMEPSRGRRGRSAATQHRRHPCRRRRGTRRQRRRRRGGNPSSPLLSRDGMRESSAAFFCSFSSGLVVRFAGGGICSVNSCSWEGKEMYPFVS